MRRHIAIITAAAAAAWFGAEGTAAAADWYVPGDSATVAGALALASSGDRVYVGPGTYAEHITVPAGVALYGSGPEVSILDGSSAGTVVQVGGDGVVVSNFSIRNAGGTYPNFGITVPNAAAQICGNLIYWNFRGVWVEGASDTHVLWNISADNEDDGLDGVNATAYFRGNTVVSNGNPAIADGDIGIYLLSVDVRAINENIVAHNNEYGIWCDGQTTSNHNDVFDHQNNFTSCGADPTDFSSDPLFVSWSDDNDPRNDDFHLQPGSPCEDVIAAPPYDADGSDRDLGAHGGQGYQSAPRPTWAMYAEVDTTEVAAGSTANIELVAWPDMLRCDHGVDRLELTLPGFLSGLQVTGVQIGGNPASYQLSGNAPVVVELAQVLGQSATIRVTLEGSIPANATGTETIAVRAGMAFINRWTDGEAGDGDSGGAVDTMSLTIQATDDDPDGGVGGSGTGGTGTGGSGTGGTGTGGTAAGGTGTGGSGTGAQAAAGAGATGGETESSGDCGCRAVGTAARSRVGAATALGLLALALMGHRRGRRRRRGAARPVT